MIKWSHNTTRVARSLFSERLRWITIKVVIEIMVASTGIVVRLFMIPIRHFILIRTLIITLHTIVARNTLQL